MMPRRDGTGPMGMGPKTGRGAGFCAGFVVPGYQNPGFGCGAGYGRGFGRGYGRGRGFCRGFFFAGAPAWAPSGYPVYAPAGTEKDFLSQQAEILENQLEQVKKRLQELDEDQE